MVSRALLAACVCVGLLAGSVSAAPLVGDADCSGGVDSRDAFAVLSLDVGYRELSTVCTTNADVNGDGRITPVDALLILQYDAGIIDGLG